MCINILGFWKVEVNGLPRRWWPHYKRWHWNGRWRRAEGEKQQGVWVYVTAFLDSSCDRVAAVQAGIRKHHCTFEETAQGVHLKAAVQKGEELGGGALMARGENDRDGRWGGLGFGQNLLCQLAPGAEAKNWRLVGKGEGPWKEQKRMLPLQAFWDHCRLIEYVVNLHIVWQAGVGETIPRKQDVHRASLGVTSKLQEAGGWQCGFLKPETSGQFLERWAIPDGRLVCQLFCKCLKTRCGGRGWG
jgi:hypothetical protein